jgi:hypothetical protein
MKTIFLGLVSLVCLAGCSSRLSSATAHGSVHGVTFDARDAGWYLGFRNPTLILSSGTDVCAILQGHGVPSSSHALVMTLSDSGPTTYQVSPNVQTINAPGPQVEVLFYSASQCAKQQVAKATGGELVESPTDMKPTATTEPMLSGTFNVSFDGGDTLNGTFNAANCDGPFVCY